MNFSQAIAARGINEKQAVSNLKRRESYHRRLDRPKIFACSPTPCKDDLRAFEVLKNPPSTPAYVFAWCRLNHLKGV
jgi:hypothetical protein